MVQRASWPFLDCDQEGLRCPEPVPTPSNIGMIQSRAVTAALVVVLQRGAQRVRRAKKAGGM